MNNQTMKWFPTPIKTEWGEGMVMSDLAIDNDHTVSIYCEADQTKKVEAMFKREWVGLTDEEIDAAVKSCNTVDTYKYFRAIEAKLKEKNCG